MKKQSNLSRLMGYAGRRRYLAYASWVLSAVSALIALVPYWYIWRIIQEVLAVAPDFQRAAGLVRNGWMAVLFAVIAVLVYIAGLMCSHMGAFRVKSFLLGNPNFWHEACELLILLLRKFGFPMVSPAVID